MWTNSLLKNNAKNALRGKWGRAVLAMIIVSLLSDLSNALYARLMNSHSHFFSVLIPAFLVGIALRALLDNIIAVGKCRYMMENRLGRPPLGTLFSGYHSDFANLVKVQFLVNLKITLGFFLIIPGIIWYYKYAMVSYLLAENPSMTYTRAIELSSDMMEGEKMQFFLLQLSFLGWVLLCALTMGIGFLFLIPYIEATTAEFYAAMRAKAFSMGLSDEVELAGFYVY